MGECSYRSRGQQVLRRMTFPVLACATTFLAGCASTTPRPSVPSAGIDSASSPAEFARVRADYGERDDFAQLCEIGNPMRELVELTNSRRFDEVLALSEPWLAKCPVDIDARYLTVIALTELGRPQEADEHLRWYRGLIESVLASGDGNSPETAYSVISISEEYSILHALKLRPKSQALIDGGIDAMTVEGEGGESTVYFNPSAHFRRLARDLEGIE